MANKARSWVNQNSTLVTIAAVILLLVSLGFIVMTNQPMTIPVIDVYYYDLNTGRLFTAKSDQVPPVAAPSGPQENGAPAGVKAYVYSCGDCGKEEERWIGWLEMYTPQLQYLLTNPEAMEAQMNNEEADMELWENGHRIAVLPDPNAEPDPSQPAGLLWVPSESNQGFDMMQNVELRCGEETPPKPCMPSGPIG